MVYEVDERSYIDSHQTDLLIYTVLLTVGGIATVVLGMDTSVTEHPVKAAAYILAGYLQLALTLGLWQRKSWGYVGILGLYVVALPLLLLANRLFAAGYVFLLTVFLLSKWRLYV